MNWKQKDMAESFTSWNLITNPDIQVSLAKFVIQKNISLREFPYLGLLLGGTQHT